MQVLVDDERDVSVIEADRVNRSLITTLIHIHNTCV
jgi:hypothetical protein